MSRADLCSLSIAQLAHAFRTGEASPVEATEAELARIEELDGKVNTFVTLTPELALRQARHAQEELARGHDHGPLQGVPIGLKDLYATKGIRTTAHSKVLLDWIPDDDAACTARLEEAGAVLLGKLAMHEFAWGAPGFDTPFPPARNPWDLSRSPSGSSSGSGAALAARLCFGALGSDTGGSIRGPAHVCGITGLKTTYGLVSRYGVVPLSWSLDTCGPMARTVEDCAIMLDAIAGHDSRDPASVQRPAVPYRASLADGHVRGRRIGVPRTWIDGTQSLDPEVLAAFEGALAELRRAGAEVVDVDGQPFIDARTPHMVIMLAEAYAYHEADLKARPQDFGSGPRTRLREASVLTAADYIHAQRVRSAVARRIHEIFESVDVIATPGGARPAVKFEDASNPAAGPMGFTGPFNLYGGPAIVVPCGFSSEGLPIGLQVAGRAFDEVSVLRMAAAYQQATDWHLRAPNLE
ncbi:MAG TPA: amidase [Chloroflexota bacterium]|nr:amidase [Chloroflexota bacterium]